MALQTHDEAEQINSSLSKALESSNFDTALLIIQNLTKEQRSQLILRNQRNPLHYACQFGRVDIVRHLISSYQYSIESRDEHGCTPLHVAAQYGQLQIVKCLLGMLFTTASVSVSLKVDIKLAHSLMLIYQQKLSDLYADSNGNSPLHTASIHGKLEIVKFLVTEIGCDLFDINHHGMSCLHLAAQHGHLALVKYLIEEVGSDMTLVDKHGRSPSYLAAEKGHLHILKYLLEDKGVSPHFNTTGDVISVKGGSVSNKPRRSLVHVASAEGHLEVVKYLIQHHGVDYSCRDKSNITPLHLACRHGHMDVVVYFIAELRCDPKRLTNKGSNCLHAACYSGRLDIIRYLIDEHHFEMGRDNNGLTPLHMAASQGSLEVVQFLIEQKQCNPHDKDGWGKTSLHYASQTGHVDVVQYLFEIHHCDMLCLDKDKNSPLHLATGNGHLEVIIYLTVACNCDPLLKLGHNNTPFHYAALHGHLHVVKFFIEELRSDPYCRGDCGRTPLHLASEKGHLELVQYLVKHCDPLCPDDNQHTPLHRAACGGHLNVIKYLTVVKQCDPLVRNAVNSTHFHFAATYGHLNLINFFVEELKLDPYCRGSYGRTPLHLASANGHLDLVQYLVEHCDPLCPDENEDTPLHGAAWNGHLDVVRYFVTVQHCNPLVSSASNSTPLHYAAQQGHLEIAKYFMEEVRCDPNTAGHLGRTPLHLACRHGHMDVVVYFFAEMRCDPKRLTNRGSTCLHAACYSGRLDIIKYLIDEHHFEIGRDNDGVTPLHAAASQGSLEVVQFLIEQKQCNPHDKDELGKTPLHYASQTGHVDVVQYLFEIHHCDMLCLDNDKNSPLHLATGNGHLEVIIYLTAACNCDPLLKLGHNNTPFHYAAWQGHLHVVKFFIEELGSDPYCRGDYGSIPLHLASEKGHLELVQYLVKHCDPLCPDDNQHTPLHRAACGGHLNIIKYLTVVKQCDPLVRNADNNTPFHFAATYGHLNLINFFIEELKLDPYCRGSYGRTPLHLASANGHLDLVQYLVKHCDPLCPDENEDTPLHRAAWNEHLDVVRYFVTVQHCNPLVSSASNSTPLHYAAQQGHLEIAKCFVEEVRCDPNTAGHLGRTPLHLVCENGHLDFFHYLVKICDPRWPDDEGLTPLHVAASNDHVEIVRYLISTYFCDPKLISGHGYTSFHLAALKGQLKMVKFFTEELGCDPNARNRLQKNCLHLASENGHLDVISYLVRYCDPNSVDVSKHTPLHRAAANGHVDVVRHFTSMCYCDSLAKDADGNTPLHLAAVSGHLEVVRYFIEDINHDPNSRGSSNRVALHHASENGHLGVVEYLIAFNSDPLCPDIDGNTPIHMAAAYGQVEVLRHFYFVLHCNLMVKNNDNNTPLHLAALQGQLTAVMFFTERPRAFCDPNLKGQHDRTPLHHAISNGHFDVAKYLINLKGCDKCSLDSMKLTPLHMAAYKGHMNMVKYLTLSHRLDPHDVPNQKALYALAKNGDILNYLREYTDPLHKAARIGDVDTVRHYIEKEHWSPLKEDNHGNNLLHIAAQYGQLHVVQYLTEGLHGSPHSICDPWITNRQNQTAKQLASVHGHTHVSEYLQAIHKRPVVVRATHPTTTGQPPAIHDRPPVVTPDGPPIKPPIKQQVINTTHQAQPIRKPSPTKPPVMRLKKVMIKPSVNMLVFGFSGAGKSTLIKAYVEEGKLFRLTVKNVNLDTVGIVRSTVATEALGSVNIYDFSGQECFHVSHELILRQFAHPLVLVVVDLSSSIPVIKKQLSYWLSTLSCAASITQTTNHVIVVGSHVDRTEKRDTHLFVMSYLQKCASISYHGFVYIDCRYYFTPGMKQLRQMIVKVCTLLNQGDIKLSMMAFDEKCVLFLDYLHSLSAKFKFLTIGELSNQLKALNPSYSMLNHPKIVKICLNLCSNGLLLFLKNDVKVTESLLILDEKSVLSQVHGCLKEFKEQGGMISHTDSHIIFDALKDEMSSDQVMKYFHLTQTCTEINSCQLVSAPAQGSSKMHIFPNLVTATRPKNLWLGMENNGTRLYSWELKCTGAHQFYTPLTLQCLFLDLLKHVTSVRSTRFTIWKNGIMLFHDDMVRSLVEVAGDSTHLNLVMEAVRGNEMHLVKQRSLLISLIHDSLHKVYPKFAFDECFILPQSSYPPGSDGGRIPLSEVALSVLTGRCTVSCGHDVTTLVSDPLFFDSFLMMDEVVIQTILAYRESDQAHIVHKDVLAKVYDAVKMCDFLARSLRSAKGWVSITYNQLFKELSKYTIFTSRNIYDVAGIQFQLDSVAIRKLQHGDTSTPRPRSMSAHSVPTQERDIPRSYSESYSDTSSTSEDYRVLTNLKPNEATSIKPNEATSVTGSFQKDYPHRVIPDSLEKLPGPPKESKSLAEASAMSEASEKTRGKSFSHQSEVTKPKFLRKTISDTVFFAKGGSYSSQEQKPLLRTSSDTSIASVPEKKKDRPLPRWHSEPSLFKIEDQKKITRFQQFKSGSTLRLSDVEKKQDTTISHSVHKKPSTSDRLKDVNTKDHPLTWKTITRFESKDRLGRKKMLNLAGKIRTKWLMVGTCLALSNKQLKAWEVEHQGNMFKCLESVLTCWLEGEGTQYYPATWDGFYQLLRAAECAAVAEDVKTALIDPPTRPSLSLSSSPPN